MQKKKKELSKSAIETIDMIHAMLDKCQNDNEFINLLMHLNQEFGKFLIRNATGMEIEDIIELKRGKNEKTDYIG